MLQNLLDVEWSSFLNYFQKLRKDFPDTDFDLLWVIRLLTEIHTNITCSDSGQIKQVGLLNCLDFRQCLKSERFCLVFGAV